GPAEVGAEGRRGGQGRRQQRRRREAFDGGAVGPHRRVGKRPGGRVRGPGSTQARPGQHGGVEDASPAVPARDRVGVRRLPRGEGQDLLRRGPAAKPPPATETDQPPAIHPAQAAKSAAASSTGHQGNVGPGPMNGETSQPAKAPTEPKGGVDAAESSASTRHVNLRRKPPPNANPPSARADTPAENGGGVLFQLVADFVKSEKSTRISTPEGVLAGELNDVTLWFARAFKALASPSDVYDKKNAGRFDKLIQAGERLAELDRAKSLDIDEDATLVDGLRGAYSRAVDDEVKRLLVLQARRDKFLRWGERADAAMSKDKVPVETLIELNAESGAFPPSSEIVIRVRNKTRDANAWVRSVQGITSGKKFPYETARIRANEGDRLNITCPEYKTLGAAVRATKRWMTKAKKLCSASQSKVDASEVTELMNEHAAFLVTADEQFEELRQLTTGYCLCRQSHDGFMISCDTCGEWFHGECIGVTPEQASKVEKYICVRCSTLKVYNDSASVVATIIQKWSGPKGLTKSRTLLQQRFTRKVRTTERDLAKAQEEKAKFEQELRALQAKAAARKLPPAAAPSGGVQAPIISSPAGAKHVAPGHVQSSSANLSAAHARPSGFAVPSQPSKMANALLLGAQTQQVNAENGTPGIVSS
ncbi:hypothetical protein THAOC_11852, partial [Thalassiosira oceanica]